MNAELTCLECGARLPADAPQGLCPQCLMGAAFATTGAHARAGSGAAGLDLLGFRRAVLELGLVSAEEWDRFAAQVPGEVARVAQALVQARKLTSYQAAAIVQGKARGLIVGDYLVLDRLGSGGMGLVLRARDRRDGREVALKLLPPSFGRDPEAVRRFRREVEIAARLDHPNVVAALAAGEDRGVHFMTMEYVPGHDLDKLVQLGGPLPIKLALHCVIQAALGLEAAHRQGIIHRDIKPGNIMLDRAGTVRVLDLGLARVVEAANLLGRSAGGTLTQTGTYMGTVDFMAPEQADDPRQADHRADIYSLGCTLYFLLAGRPPFLGDTALKRLLAHQERPAPSLQAARPEVPAALEEIYQRMMAKQPEQRPPALSAVVAALESCRRSRDDARTAPADLEDFARTVLKRAAARRGQADSSLFARRNAAGGLDIDPDRILDDDVVTGFRKEEPVEELPEEKLPPRPPRPIASRRRSRPETVPLIWGTLAVVALTLVVVVALRGGFLAPAPPASPRRTVQSEPAPPAPIVVEPVRTSPTATTVTPRTGRVLFVDTFDDPRSGWANQSAAEWTREAEEHHGYVNGLYRLEAKAKTWWLWTCPARLPAEFTCEFLGRAYSDQPGSRGTFGLHIDCGPGRGVQLGVYNDGRFRMQTIDGEDRVVYPPTPHRAIRTGRDAFNRVVVHLTQGRFGVWINGERVCDPIRLPWEASPTELKLGIDCAEGTMRAEYDRFEIRELDPGAAAELAAVSRTPTGLGRVFYGEEFTDPATGWERTRLGGWRKDYENGIYFLEAPPGWSGTHATDCTGPLSEEFQADATGRVLGVGEAVGGWGVLIVGPDAGRGFAVQLDRNGVVTIDPSFWGLAKYPNDPHYATIRHPAVLRGNQWNRLSVRVRRRQLEVLVNGAAIHPPIPLDWDLTPGKAQLALMKPDFGTRVRVEFERVEIRELR